MQIHLPLVQMRPFAISIASIFLFAVYQAQAIPITTSDSGFLLVDSRGATGPVSVLPGDFDQLSSPSALPFSFTHTSAASNGSASSTATYNFVNSTHEASFNLDFVQSIVNGFNANTGGRLSFTLAESANYTLQGAMQGIGDSDDFEIEYSQFLSLRGTSGFLFNENDVTVGNSADFVFGDGTPGLGSLTGLLLPGSYSFSYQTRLGSDGTIGLFFDQTASSTANVSLTLTSLDAPTDVPAPGTLFLLLAGLVSLRVRGRF